MSTNKARPKTNASKKAGTTTEAGAAPEKKQPAKLKPITAEEQAIAARITADSNREWETITEESTIDYRLGRDAFELPLPAKKAQNEKQYAFRWIARTQGRIDEMRNKQVPERWWVCNATNTPFLDGFFDPVLGGVCREDQILMFKPWWMHQKHRDMVNRMSEVHGQDITRKDREKRGSAEFVAGARVDGSQLRQEVKPGDSVFYDGDVEERPSPTGADLSDITI